MAANKVGKRLFSKTHSPSRNRDPGQAVQRRQARVTVKYNRKELQKRLDVEKWIDESMEHLYEGREMDIPDEVDIDDLLELETDEQRRSALQILLRLCRNNTEEFIENLLFRLKGLQKQTLLRKNGLDGSNEDSIMEQA